MVLLLIIVTIPFFLLSCNDNKMDEPEVEPLPKAFFEIEKISYKISAEAQTFDVRIHTNIKAIPKILNDASTWVSVSVSEQTDVYLTYQVSVKENTANDEREGMIYFTPVSLSGIMIDESKLWNNTIVITQAGAES